MRLTSQPGGWTNWAARLCVVGGLAWAVSLTGAEIEAARNFFQTGNYAECIRVATQAIGDSARDEDWPQLLARAQLATGQYPEAQTTAEQALDRQRYSVRLRLLALDVAEANGLTNRVAEILDDLHSLGGSRPRSNRDALDLVTWGQVLLRLQADPKLVLENFLDPAKRLDPKRRDAWLVTGELALEKHDFALAAKTFTEALQKFPDDPDAEFGLARAYAPSDRAQMGRALEAVLAANTNHVPALVLLADHLVDAEEYAGAEELLTRALRVNPWDPAAWAYRAVLAQLRSDPNTAAAARRAALKYASANPRVDQLIGSKLSQKYRFREGAASQRQALAFDPQFLPAKIQLAQDLLRLGEEAEGWQRAQEVHDRDGYDVTAYNLVTLRSTLAKFQTLTNENFIVRLSPREAAIYGDRVLALLQQARTRLSVKYGWAPAQPTIVEIFPDQKDFGVRTFGLPHNPGFLGVCFGRVVTANSPAAQVGHPANWEAVLWHEYCHAITLGITGNQMPRWLSEGISVYEERQANPTWGQAINPRYREMILGEDFTPVARLSAAFLTPKSDFHVQFAYYESSLVVEYLVQTFGHAALKEILTDLGQGTDINVALARRTVPLEKFESGFAEFARARARSLGPGLDWTKPKWLAAKPGDSKEESTAPHPPPRIQPLESVQKLFPARESVDLATTTNYWELSRRAGELVEQKKWAEAKPPLERLVQLYPGETGTDSAAALLARTCRNLQETERERATLTQLAARAADDPDTFQRLIELNEAAGDWAGVRTNAERFLAVNPLVPPPYRALARAGEALGDARTAIRSWERLLLLEPPDPAEVHFRLARLLRSDEPARARRQVLEALEEAPRFRAAQQLLLELHDGVPAPTSATLPANP